MNFTNSPKYQNNPVLKETFELALMIVNYTELLEKNHKFVIAKQLIREIKRSIKTIKQNN